SDTDIELFKELPSPYYAPASDANTEPLETPASPDYTPGSDTESEPSEHDSDESSEEDSTKEDSSSLDDFHHTPRTNSIPTGYTTSTHQGKRVRAPFTLPPSIEAAIAEEIAAPPRKSIEVVEEEMETIHAELGASREMISDLEFYIEDIETRLEASKARKIRLRARWELLHVILYLMDLILVTNNPRHQQSYDVLNRLTGTDIANITRKWPKWDKNGHENGKSIHAGNPQHFDWVNKCVMQSTGKIKGLKGNQGLKAEIRDQREHV
nr:hypothetical protein [Tanacetum cinerariifolium]